MSGIVATNYHVIPGNARGLVTVITEEDEEYGLPEVEIIQTSVSYQFCDFTILRVRQLATENPKAQMPISKKFGIKKYNILGFMQNSYGNLTREAGRISDRYPYRDTDKDRGCMSCFS